MINSENDEIIKKGDANIEVLSNIKNQKIEQRKKEFEMKKLELMINDFKEKAKDVRNYRVTK